MEIYKCELCDIIFNNFQLKANHVRWYHRDNSIGNKKNSKTKIEKTNLLKGELTNFLVNCFRCNKQFVVVERKKLFPKKEKYFCNQSCANYRIFSLKTRKKLGLSTSIAIKKLWQNEEYSKKMLNRCKRFTSKWEVEIRTHFIEKFSNDEWTFGFLTKYKDFILTCDLYSKKLKVVIECDGIWHFKDIHGQLKHKQEVDKKLENWCIENNWKLIRIKNEVYDQNKEFWLKALVKEAYNKKNEIIKFYDGMA